MYVQLYTSRRFVSNSIVAAEARVSSAPVKTHNQGTQSVLMIILISLQMQVRGYSDYLVAAISDSEACQGSEIIPNQSNNEECKNHKQEYIRCLLRQTDHILYTFKIKFMEILNR